MLKVIDLVGGAFVLILSSLIYGYILLEPKNFKITFNKIIMLVLGIALYGIIANYTDGTIKSLFLCVLYYALFRKIYKISNHEGVILTFLYVILIMIPDILFTLFSISILEIEPEIFYGEYAKRIFATTVINIIFILMICILKKPLRKLIKLKPNINKEVIVYTILSLICILVVFYNATADIKIISDNLVKENSNGNF